MTEEEKKYQKQLWKQDRARERKEELEKIRGMGMGARLQYFWDYYKIVLVIALFVLLGIYLAVTMIQGARTDTLLYVCFLNAEELDPDTETLQEDYIQARGGLDRYENMVFDSSVWVNPDASGTSQRDVAAAIKLTSYVGAGTLDVFVAPPHVTKYEQESGMLLKLEDVLSEEEVRRLKAAGCLYYDSEPETESLSGAQEDAESWEETECFSGARDEGETGSQSGTSGDMAVPGGYEKELGTQPAPGSHIYAVRIDPAGVIGNYKIYGADSQVWFSIIGNTGRTEEAVRFLRFLIGEEDAP